MVRHIHLVQLHGFGQRYYLPAPLFLYLFASVVVVVLSFVLAAALEGSSTVDPNRPYPRWRAGWLLPIATSRPLLVACRVLGPVLLGIVIVTALAGPPDPLQNAAAYLIWIYAWVVLALLAAAIGNLWALINPFDAIYQGLVRLFHLNGPRRILPERAGIWPAVLLFLLVAWFELASGLATSMTLIGWGTIAYTVLTVSGMLTFGSQQWLSRAEIFTVLTDIASRLGPTEVERDAKGQACASWLRPWGAGLLGPVEGGWDRIAFLILMLSNLAFDGIESTPQWSDFATGLKPQLTSFFGGAERTVLYTSGLLITALLFFVVFRAVMAAVMGLGGARGDRLGVLTQFAYTLVPIAIAYEAAHNWSYVAVVGQEVIPTLADPLGKGWDLLGLQHFQPNQALGTPQDVWLGTVSLIVIGHVVAVLLSHRRAVTIFSTGQRALISQYPMLLLMVAYTFTSLWILAQPTTG